MRSVKFQIIVIIEFFHQYNDAHISSQTDCYFLMHKTSLFHMFVSNQYKLCNNATFKNGSYCAVQNLMFTSSNYFHSMPSLSLFFSRKEAILLGASVIYFSLIHSPACSWIVTRLSSCIL